jgi:hypothetical protein
VNTSDQTTSSPAEDLHLMQENDQSEPIPVEELQSMQESGVIEPALVACIHLMPVRLD